MTAEWRPVRKLAAAVCRAPQAHRAALRDLGTAVVADEPRSGMCQSRSRGIAGAAVTGTYVAMPGIRHGAESLLLSLVVACAVSTSPSLATALRDPTPPEAAHQVQRHIAVEFAFSDRDPAGRPARWSPCQVIQLAVNPASAPAGAMRELQAAVRVVSTATGLRMRLAKTTQSPTADWGLQSLPGQPGRWPPVLVSFGVPGQGVGDLRLRGSSSGLGGVEGTTADRVGFPAVNTRHNRFYGGGRDGRPSRQALFEHELGHIVGLDHVRDRSRACTRR